jgi:hypothetical protein
VRLSATSAASSLINPGATFFRASCGTSVDVGDVVYLTGNIVGGLPEVDTVDIDASGENPGVGVVLKKRTSTICIIQVSGIIRNVYTGLTPGNLLFVAPGGSITGSIPSAPSAGRRAIQHVGSVLQTGEVLLDIKDPTYRIPA